MDKLTRKKFVMVSNRGPNFITPGKKHTAMGGTKGIYPQIMEAFCDSWLCLSSDELNTGDVTSGYGDQLDILFLDPKTYHQYYFEYVSEQLYPALLGYKNLGKEHPRRAFDTVMERIVARLSEKHPGQDVIICDYHLYNLPKLLPADLTKVFFWFIPILTIDKYDESIREILDGLNHATELYFFDDVWAQNFINLFYHFRPNEELRAKIKTLMMGPDDFYARPHTSTREDYERLLEKSFGEVPMGKHIISVSRMDFVKRLPLLIEGFESYVDATGDHEAKLLLFAPHHRPDSGVYVRENERIKEMAKKSRYRDQIFLTHEHTESADLRTIFTFADMFVCPSKHDAMPLTPLEYILANDGNGSVVLSESLGACRLLNTLAPAFEADNANSLGGVIARTLQASAKERSATMGLMKQVVGQSTIQKAMPSCLRSGRKVQGSVTILGSGDTLGTPIAGCERAACLDADPKSRRYRFGLLLRLGNTTILIDPNPDLKWQCLDSHFELKEVDHVLVTHHHSDHVNGLGEFFYRRSQPTQLWYGEHPLNHKLVDYWRYLEREDVLAFKTFRNYQSFALDNEIVVTPVELNHGFPTSGFVIEWQGQKIAIVTDTNAMLNEQTLKALGGVDHLFIDTFSEDLEQVRGVYEDCGIETPDLASEWFHMTMPEVKSLQETVMAAKVYTVHMSRHMSPHQQLVEKHQTNKCIIGYDGLVVTL